MPYDIKADFPFFKNNKDVVWLDSAATAQKPECMAAALTDFYNNHNSNVSRGEYPAADAATRLYEEARATAARWFGVSPEAVAFTSGATDSLSAAADAVGERVSRGDNMIVSALEHNSALLPIMRICEKQGAELRYIPLLPDGGLDLDALPSLADERTRAAVVTAGSNVSGYRTPLEEVCGFFSDRKIPLVVDAAQAAAHGRIDASGLCFEYMCVSAHKLYGPTGTGLLIAGSDAALNRAWRPGGGTVLSVGKDGCVKKSGAAGVEAGTPNAAGAFAFAKVLDYLSGIGIEDFWRKEARLAETLRERLAALGMRVVPGGKDPFPVVSFDPGFIHPLDAARLLGSMGICVRNGRHCAHIAHDALGFDSTLRASFGVYNDESDVERLCGALAFLKGRYGNVS